MAKYAAAVQSALFAEIALLRSQLDQALGAGGVDRQAPRRAPSGGDIAAPARPSDAAAEIVSGLDQRIERLSHVRDWIDEDNELANLIDKVIGGQVAAAMCRQRAFNVAFNIVFLIAGWLLSLLATPDNLFRLIHR